MNLSIVHIVEEQHKDIINELAYILGMGGNSLSIKLQDQSGNIYYGCHSWWLSSKYIMFKDHMGLNAIGINMTPYKAALIKLREFLIDTQNMSHEEIENIPFINWHNALSEMELDEIALNIEEKLV